MNKDTSPVQGGGVGTHYAAYGSPSGGCANGGPLAAVVVVVIAGTAGRSRRSSSASPTTSPSTATSPLSTRRGEKLQALKTEATTLSAQLTLLQRDTSGLTAENNELKLCLQTMEQQVHLQDALNDALRDEVQRLKLATGQMPNGGAATMMNFVPPHSFGTSQQFYHHNQAMQSIPTARQLQQLQIHSQRQQPPATSSAPFSASPSPRSAHQP
ncbi:putative transcription factor PosF21 [Ananas comosus]|uniref:Putative transcription factor PosF21 n=1 Tax=Ananas comosus TaxID=4615 RepID=A0A199VTH2_ANACO|nr:putative transcription factor PosF21 [Ananas comosus]